MPPRLTATVPATMDSAVSCGSVLPGPGRCGRASIPAVQNSGAFHEFPAPSWRMLDNDGFFVRNPGFEHCANTTTCIRRKA